MPPPLNKLSWIVLGTITAIMVVVAVFFAQDFIKTANRMDDNMKNDMS